MAYFRLIGGDAVGDFRFPEHGIDGIQHRPHRAPGLGQAHRPPFLAGFLYPLGEMIPHDVEGVRVGALKTVDGLFFVADHEQGAVGFPGAFAGEELIGQGLDQVPLFGTGVLGFVDQNVVQPAVQFIKHPLGGHPADQQGPGQMDKVVVIQQGALRLGFPVGIQQGDADAQHRLCRPDHGGRLDLFLQPQNPLLFGQ